MKKEWARLKKSFQYAISGLIYAVQHEKNLQIHLLASVIMMILAYLLHFNSIKWAILLITIGNVVCLELVNTAIERTIDLITKEKHPIAKAAKDVSAAAVFLFSIVAVIIGLFLFLQPLLELLKLG